MLHGSFPLLMQRCSNWNRGTDCELLGDEIQRQLAHWNQQVAPAPNEKWELCLGRDTVMLQLQGRLLERLRENVREARGCRAGRVLMR